MKKLTLSLIALGALLSIGSAQDWILVRGQNDYRAGYSTKLKTLDEKSGLTINAWLLTRVNDVNLNNFSLGDLNHGFVGFGLQYPLYRKPNFTAGLAAGWSGDISRITQRVSNGEWSIGGFLNWKL